MHCPEFLIDTASNQNLTVGRPGNEAKFSGHMEISSLAHARYKYTTHTRQMQATMTRTERKGAFEQ